MQVTKQAFVAGVAAAITFIAGAQQQPRSRHQPVTLRADAIHVRHGRAARHQGVGRRACGSRIRSASRSCRTATRSSPSAARGCGSCTTSPARKGGGGDARSRTDRAARREAGAFRGGASHEIALHPKFAENQLVYFTYNKPGDDIPTRTRRAAARRRSRWRAASSTGKALTGVQELFVGEWENGTSGSRLAFGNDGLLYMTTGAPFGDSRRRTRATSTAKSCACATTASLRPTIPFVEQAGARPEIFTLGPSRSARPHGASGNRQPC